jgi:fatty acid desaturase
MTAAATLEPNPDETDALDRALLAPLLERRDAPGLTRFAAQLTALARAGTATASLAAADSPLAWVALAATGVALLTFFPSLHEAGHGTAFRTPRLNAAVTWLSATLMLQAPLFFREFHWEHHRRTQDPERDPEIFRGNRC